jgi:dCTP deaminase
MLVTPCGQKDEQPWAWESARGLNYRRAPMIFSDRTIKEAVSAGRIVIDPYDEAMVQPSSIDLRCASEFRVFVNHRYSVIDPKADQPHLTASVSSEPDQPFILHPGEFVLGSTHEVIGLADDIVARLEGKSSLGRLGLLIHSTAGFIDPGFRGQVTLELSNVANLPIAIYPGMKIGQVSFYELSTPAENPYGSEKAGSKYQGQAGPTPSRVHHDFDIEAVD